MTASLDGRPRDQFIAAILNDRGDGSDGLVTVSGATNVSSLGGSLSGLPGSADGRIIECTGLTVNAGQTLTLDLNITVVKCTGTVTINGTINGDGGGMGLGDGAVAARFYGQAGKPPFQGNGGDSSNEPATLSGLGGARYGWRDWLFNMDSSEPNGLNYPVGGGGGGGGEAAGGSGGDGGNGGSSIIIICRDLVFGSSAVVTLDGDNGNAGVASGANSLAAGGGGGGGGFFGCIVDSYTDARTSSSTITATAGSGGAGATNSPSGPSASGGGGGGGAFNGAVGANQALVANTAGSGGSGGVGMIFIAFRRFWKVGGTMLSTTNLNNRTDPNAVTMRVDLQDV